VRAYPRKKYSMDSTNGQGLIGGANTWLGGILVFLV